MTAGSRFKSWIEGCADSWKDRLGGWMVNWAYKSLNRFLEANEPEAIDMVRSQLTAIRDNPVTPQAMKDMINKLLAGTKPIPVVILIIIGALMFIPTIVSIFRPLGNLWEQQQEKVTKSFRLDPGYVISAWRRDPAKYAKYFSDLMDQGWSDDRQELLKFVTQVIPQAPDIIRFALREVYTPEIAEKYGQFQDIPTDAYADAEKAGLPKDTFDKFWAAHWYLPSSSEGFEMLHRGVITEDELKALLKANDIMPFWRDKLINISWNVPTRVDVRRFWELRTIDEKRLREIYTSMGYHGQDLEDYVLWTKIYTDLPDLITRFKNGWLSLEDLRAELQGLGLPAAQVEEIIQTKIKAAASEKLAKDKDLTAAELVKGVKKGVITWDEGLELLQELGYDEWEAEFKLAIDVAVETGSPESYADFKDLTQKWLLATGRKGKPVTEEIKKLGADLAQRAAEVTALEKAVAAEKAKLVPDKVIPAEATARLKELEGLLHKAQAEFTRVQTDYRAKIAEWKHAGI